MLAIAGDPNLIGPLADDLEPFAVVGAGCGGLICGLPEALGARGRLRGITAVVIAAGILESLTLSGSDPHWAGLYRLVNDGPPPDEFRFFDPRSMVLSAGLIGEALSERGRRPRVLVVPAVHCLPGPAGVIPAINRILREWCASEGFGMLPDRIFSGVRGPRLYTDAGRGIPSPEWAAVVAAEASVWPDGIGE